MVRLNIELKRHVGKRVFVQMNGKRKLTGILRGYDPFLNLTLDDATDESGQEKVDLGQCIVRGNSVLIIEALERL